MPFLPEPAGGDADPEAAALHDERRGEIETALAYVRAEHRAALVLRHMQGLSYAEIAEVLGVPDGTAKGWVNRGRASMLVALTRENRGPQEVRPKTGKALWASPAPKRQEGTMKAIFVHLYPGSGPCLVLLKLVAAFRSEDVKALWLIFLLRADSTDGLLARRFRPRSSQSPL